MTSAIGRFTPLTDAGLDNSTNITAVALLSYLHGFNHVVADQNASEHSVADVVSASSTSISFDTHIISSQPSAKHLLSPHPSVTALQLQAVSLSWTDRLYLAVGCARGLLALHSFSPDLCHRDVKSFNFLVDHQLNAKISGILFVIPSTIINLLSLETQTQIFTRLGVGHGGVAQRQALR